MRRWAVDGAIFSSATYMRKWPSSSASNTMPSRSWRPSDLRQSGTSARSNLPCGAGDIGSMLSVSSALAASLCMSVMAFAGRGSASVSTGARDTAFHRVHGCSRGGLPSTVSLTASTHSVHRTRAIAWRGAGVGISAAHEMQASAPGRGHGASGSAKSGQPRRPDPRQSASCRRKARTRVATASAWITSSLCSINRLASGSAWRGPRTTSRSP